MMENFFNVRKDSVSLSEGLAFVALKDVETENFEDAYSLLKIRLVGVSYEKTSDRYTEF